MNRCLGLDSCSSIESRQKKVDAVTDKSERNYDDAFLQYGFSSDYNNGIENHLCLIGNETFSETVKDALRSALSCINP